jgi:hypothetical protein
VGRNQVIEGTPVLDTFSRVKLPSRNLLAHAGEPNIGAPLDESLPAPGGPFRQTSTHERGGSLVARQRHSSGNQVASLRGAGGIWLTEAPGAS